MVDSEHRPITRRGARGSASTRRALLAASAGAGGMGLAALLGGCAGGNAGPESGPASAAKVETGEVEWSYGGAFLASTQAQVDGYNASQSSVRVKAIFVTGNYVEKVAAMAAAGTPPDLQHRNSGQFEALSAKGAFLNLDPLIKRDKYRLDDLYPAFQEGAKFQGKYFSLPSTGANILLFYNKSLFDKAGRGYPTAEWGWRDLEDAARVLTRGAGGEQTWGFYVRNFVSNWASIIWQNGGEIWNKDSTKCVINEAPAVEALDFFYGLKTRHNVSPSAAELAAAGGERGLFMAGKLAINPTGAHQRFEYVAVDGFDWDLQILQRGKRRQNILFTDMEAIDASSKRPEATWDFLKWLVDDPGQKIRAEQVRAIPSSRKYVESEAFRANPPGKNNKAIADDMPHGRVPPNANSLFFDLGERWDPELLALLEGTRSAKVVADNMAEYANTLLKAAGGRALK